ncbi:MAG: Uncharacterised protein [Flavobacteriaceae bacterium]|nr:MAG: Uncharacterised protein [Flavobacteriaceae bacterium]
MYLIAKSVSKWYPELLLIASVIIYWVLTAMLVNPVAISLIVLLVAQLRFKNKTFGIILSFIFMLLSAYMMLAIFSDIVHLDFFYPRGLLMLCFGSLYFGGTAYFAFILLKKNNNTINERLPIGND